MIRTSEVVKTTLVKSIVVGKTGVSVVTNETKVDAVSVHISLTTVDSMGTTVVELMMIVDVVISVRVVTGF